LKLSDFCASSIWPIGSLYPHESGQLKHSP
jgi:hypothetical protein